MSSQNLSPNAPMLEFAGIQLPTMKKLMRFHAPESLSEQIAQHLGQRIIVGLLKPGERIQELKVAGELDVSRGSVREALLILERRHLIRIYPRKGAVVSQITAALVNGLYDIYINLLIMLAQKVVERWKDKDLTPMVQQALRLQKLVDAKDRPIEEIIDAGFEVMRLCYPIVANPFMEETLENFRPAISRTYYLSIARNRSEAEQTKIFFRRLIETAQARDAAGIATAIAEFGEQQRRLVLDALRQESAGSLKSVAAEAATQS